VTLIEGLELQHAHESTMRRGHMDITTVHVTLTDARAASRHDMGL
jgi:hypothetical protein